MLVALATIAVSAGLAVFAVWGVRQIYFLGTDPGGRLALYRGLPYELPFGLKLYSEQYAAPVQVSSLPKSERGGATDHTLRFHDDAASLIKHLTAVANPPKPVRVPKPPPPKPKPKPKRAASRPPEEGGERRSGAEDARRTGRKPVSARNRELLALIPVALLVAAGFAAVLIVESNKISDVSLIYGGYFLAVCVGVHIFLRIRVPHADPYLFPLCALLAAVGLVVLFRINDTLALRQASIFVAGAVLFAATVVFLRDYTKLERYRYLIAILGILLLLAPRLPGVGGLVNGAYLEIKLGPAVVPARRALEDLHRHLPRELPARAPRAPERGRPAGSSGSPSRR